MRRASQWLAVLSVLLVPALAFAQGGRSEEAARIRDQVDTLLKKLEDVETGPSDKRRYTDIDAGESRPRNADKVEILRAYDLNDLFAAVPQYPAKAPADIDGSQDLTVFPLPTAQMESVTAGGMGGGMGGMMQVGSGQMASVSGSQAGLRDVIRVIQQSTSGPWMDNDGEGGTIASIGSTLLIRTTLNNHAQIEKLLEVLRKTWGALKLVHLEVDWVWMTDDELRTLTPLAENSATRTIDDDVLQTVKDKQGAERPHGRSAEISCYNGQIVSLESLKQQPVVTSLVATVGTGVSAIQPMTKALTDGTIVQIRPIVSRTGKFVIMDVHSRLNEVELNEEQPYSSETPTVDRLTFGTQRLSTTLRAPAGKATLAGGMTYDSVHERSDEPYNLYVFIRARVEDLKEAIAAPAEAGNPTNEPQQSAPDNGDPRSDRTGPKPENGRDDSEHSHEDAKR
jgi:hypothetical protein